MASDFEKPDKVHLLLPEDVPRRLWPLPVRELFGVGPSAAKRLNELGLYTIGDLANARREMLVGVFGARGDTFWNYANGRESDPVTKQETKDNSYGNSVTLPQDLNAPAEADTTLLALCESVGGRLRMDGRTARVVTVQLVDNAFRRKQPPGHAARPDQFDRCFVPHGARAAAPGLARPPGAAGGRDGRANRTDNFEQLDLFSDPARRVKQEKLDRAADALRARFGEDAVLRAKLLQPDEKAAAPRALARPRRGTSAGKTAEK